MAHFLVFCFCSSFWHLRLVEGTIAVIVQRARGLSEKRARKPTKERRATTQTSHIDEELCCKMLFGCECVPLHTAVIWPVSLAALILHSLECVCVCVNCGECHPIRVFSLCISRYFRSAIFT